MKTTLGLMVCLVLWGCDDDPAAVDAAQGRAADTGLEADAAGAAEDAGLAPDAGAEAVGITWVALPGGTFTMGGDSRDGDSPEVSVTVSPFRMAASEVTNAQYVAFLNAALADGWVMSEVQVVMSFCGRGSERVILGAGPAPDAGAVYLQLGETGGCTSQGEPEHIDNRSWITFDEGAGVFALLDESKGDWPVNWVKWPGANAFAVYYGWSLPTEAQWEYAAHGGRQDQYATADGLLSAAQANYNGDQPGVHNAEGHAVAVGSYDANPFGLYDMSGNVWEWCLDYYAADAYVDGATDPVHAVPGADGKRVRRGGSWNYHAATLQSHARASDFPNRGNNHFGFRVAAPTD
jgi:formylglycine-generating enzyme required for sulfatase activity